MWKRPDDLSAHIESRGPRQPFDPFTEVNTLLVTAEDVYTDGDHVILRMWSVTARLKADAIVAWRQIPTDRDSQIPLYQLRIKRGTHVLLQKGVVLDTTHHEDNGMNEGIWDGTPPKELRPHPHQDRNEGQRKSAPKGEHHHGHHEHHHSDHAHGDHGHDHQGHDAHHHAHHEAGAPHHHHGHGHHHHGHATHPMHRWDLGHAHPHAPPPPPPAPPPHFAAFAPPPPPPPPPFGAPIDRRPGDPGPDGRR